eukprot:755415-Hanusia_phi.AAC.1
MIPVRPLTPLLIECVLIFKRGSNCSRFEILGRVGNCNAQNHPPDHQLWMSALIFSVASGKFP